MGKSKHYKLGKTSRVFIPEAIALEILDLVRLLDELEDPQEMIHLLTTIIKLKIRD
jgi:hypothetical protein